MNNGHTEDVGAEMELAPNGQVILRNWPIGWLGVDGSGRHTAFGRWDYFNGAPGNEEVAFNLSISKIDNGQKPIFDGPVYWSSFWNTNDLEIAVRDPDSGLPKFSKER